MNLNQKPIDIRTLEPEVLKCERFLGFGKNKLVNMFFIKKSCILYSIKSIIVIYYFNYYCKCINNIFNTIRLKCIYIIY